GGPGAPSERANATAHAHYAAAAAHRPGGPGRAAAVANHAAWAHAYRAHHPFRFSRAPVFVAWYPGYPRYCYQAVFVHAPPPGAPPDAEPAPRKVNHEGQWAIGVRAGAYSSGYTNGASFGDAGLGLAARYRVVDPLGLELQWTYHDQTWAQGTERIDAPLSA